MCTNQLKHKHEAIFFKKNKNLALLKTKFPTILWLKWKSAQNESCSVFRDLQLSCCANFHYTKGFWIILNSLQEFELIKEIYLFGTKFITILDINAIKLPKSWLLAFCKKTLHKIENTSYVKAFCKKGLVILHNYTYALNLHWKFLTIKQG